MTQRSTGISFVLQRANPLPPPAARRTEVQVLRHLDQLAATIAGHVPRSGGRPLAILAALGLVLAVLGISPASASAPTQPARAARDRASRW